MKQDLQENHVNSVPLIVILSLSCFIVKKK